MAIVAIVTFETIVTIVIVVVIETVMASSRFFRTQIGYQIQKTRSKIAKSSSYQSRGCQDLSLIFEGVLVLHWYGTLSSIVTLLVRVEAGNDSSL